MANVTPTHDARPGTGSTAPHRLRPNVTTKEDIANVAGQLAELTRTVEGMAKQLTAVSERADSQQARADSQQSALTPSR
jgi:hypothetical protein